MQLKNLESTNTEKWLIEELTPEQSDVIIPNEDIKALISKDGTILQINLPNMLILCPSNPYLEAGMELQFVQDERKEDFQLGILGLVRLATYMN